MSEASNLPEVGTATAPPPRDDPRHVLRERRGFVARVAYEVAGRTGARVGLAWVGIMVLAAVFAPFLANSHPFLWKHQGQITSPWLEHLTPTDVALLLAFVSGVVAAALWRVPAGWRFALWVLLMALVLPGLYRAGFADRIDTIMQVPPQQRHGLVPIYVQLSAGLLVCLIAIIGVLWRSAAGWPWKLGVVVLAVGLNVLFLIQPIVPPKTVIYQQYREAAAAGEIDWVVYAPVPYSPKDRQYDVLQATGKDPRRLQPEPGHWMGTTTKGADVLSRMIYASRIALTIGLIATGIAATIGIIVGGVMGYFSRAVDLFGMRCVEIFSAIPVIFLLIMIVAFWGRSLYLMTVVLGLTGWVGYALYVRAEFLKIRSMDYVQAARAAGVPLWSILFRHMLPNGITPVLVLASFGIASMILTESTLSFIGLGLTDDPSWGQMLNEAREAVDQWGLIIFPGLAIFLTVFAYNLIGEAMRDALDPHMAGK